VTGAAPLESRSEPFQLGGHHKIGMGHLDGTSVVYATALAIFCPCDQYHSAMRVMLYDSHQAQDGVESPEDFCRDVPDHKALG
jgi:hypothetical protein